MLDALARPHITIIAALCLALTSTPVWAFSVIDKEETLAQAEVQAQDQPRVQPGNQPGNEPALQQRVRALTDFVDRFELDDRWQQDPEAYTERGIRLFVSALGPLIPENDAEYGERYRLLNERLGGIDDAPGVEGGPHHLSEALVEAVELLALVQWRHYPQFTEAIAPVSRATEAIDLPLPPTGQLEATRSVLTEAALAIERLANAPPSFTGQDENGQPMRGPVIERPVGN